MKDKQFLDWVADRFVKHHGESESVDFVQKLRSIALMTPEGQETDFLNPPAPFRTCPYQYVLIRTDLPNGTALAQTTHAAAIAALELIPGDQVKDFIDHNRVVVLGVKSEAELMQYASNLYCRDIRYSIFLEPGPPCFGQHTALSAIVWDRTEIQEILKSLKRYDGPSNQAPCLDTQRLDYLQATSQGYGKGWLLRISTTGRGMRLHETSAEGAVPNVRDAIDRNAAARGGYAQ